MQWFRYPTASLNDSRVQRLTGDLFKVWVNLLCLAAQHGDNGWLPPLDIGFYLRLDDQKVADALRGLMRAGLVEEVDGVHRIRDWDSFVPPDADRNAPAYRAWRASVLERDRYTCQDCGAQDLLEAHHILRYAKESDQRFVIENGVTLCADCHKTRHAQEGR